MGGKASFHLGEYDRAKDFFKEGKRIDSSSKTGFNQWMIWCDEKMAKLKKISEEAAATKAKKQQPATATPPLSNAESTSQSKLKKFRKKKIPFS